MAEPTEADRERAMHVMAWDPLSYAEFAKAVNDGGNPDDRDSLEMVDDIAKALADERERARAPFLALASELDVFVANRGLPAAGSYDAGLNRAQANAAYAIRRAAEEAGQ